MANERPLSSLFSALMLSVMRPQWATDPDFARALVAAHEVGVEVYAYTCRLTTAEIGLAAEVPIELDTDS